MAWLRLDDGFDTHPKLLELTELQRWRWTRVLIHCARHRTEGVITPSALRELGLARSTQQLLSLGLLDEDERGYVVHDWTVYNPRDPSNAERQQRHRERIKAKNDAHKAVAKAVVSGELERQPCQECQSTYHVVAHHEDYSRPLDVTWLCRVCHAKRHAEVTAAVTVSNGRGNGGNRAGNTPSRAGARVRPVPSPEKPSKAVPVASNDSEPEPSLSDDEPADNDRTAFDQFIETVELREMP